MRKHSTHSISRVFSCLLILLIAGVNLTMAQGLSSNDIKASWDFKNGTVAYSIVSADIPAGSTFSWKVDSKNVTDGISDSGQTITLPLTNKTKSGEVTITSAGNAQQTIAFSIEPKAYGVDYDGNHFYADSYQLYPDGSEGDGSKEKPFLISNDMELARLAHEVNNGAAQQMFSQKYFKLTKDIDLSKGLWTPIGTAQGIAKATDGHFFAGKFDGDGRSISNMLISWTFSDLKEASWGLFSRLNGKGNNENEYASVSNLIIDNARIEKKAAHTPLNNANYTVKMGIVVADMTQNAELSNIIIRNSKISDNNESYTTKTKFRIGGIAGYLNNFVSLRIFNISADTEIDMFQNAALNGVEGQVTISCGFGAASKLANQTGYAVWPRNIYVHGADLKTSANTTQCKKASVMAFIAADNFASKVKDTWYYTPANKAADTYAYNQYGVEKEISVTDPSTGEPFGKAFANLNNLYINQNNLDKRPWSYSNSSKRFSFSSIALKAERGTSDVLTVTTEDGETTSDVYNWYASTDNTEGEKVNSSACNPFILPRQIYSQYVYAMTVDGSQRTNTVLVEAIGITAELDYETKPGTYIINVTNNTKENFTNDELGLDITYEWYNKGTLLSETSNEFVRPETATNKDQFNCTVTVKSGGNIIFRKNIKVTIVVYLCPEAVSINGTTYAQGDDNDDEEWGYSPTQAMKTWKGAYSKLAKTGTWDENIIVLMGTSGADVTNNQYTGFNITSNNRGKNMLKLDEWTKAKGESPLFRNATITGEWNGTDYKGTIEISGAERGLPIWGDTRFEYITFNNDPVTNNGGDFYKIIYCQYNNLEMGEGIQMTGFGQNSPNYGTIDGAVTTAFHIFGGFNNDGRFYPLDRKERIEAFEQSMPHGKEGFKISIKSGLYSAISAGGRQTSSEKDYNGVMGTPNQPIKCTIEMDIDRKWNDAHNPEREIKGETSKRKSDYDAGIILAGSHEGAMYADVDIIIRSGKVARVVNGSLGAQRDFILPYNGTDYYVPNNTYMGRANILLDPASSKYNNDEWIDNRVIVTELYGGSTGRGHTGNVIVNNPFYGYSTITINGGLFEILPTGNTKTDNIFCGIYGAGAGGMNGIGEGDDIADSHTPDKSIAYWNASGDVMLYGPYAVAKDRLVTYRCYNNDDFESFIYVDPTNTSTKIVINGGEFGSTTEPIDGIYGGGSGFMSKGLWSSTAATPNSCGGNVYGKTGATVASLTINGGEFHCKNGVFAGGRGTDFFYSQNPYGGNSGDYKALGKTYGNVELNINGGIFYCPVFGGGYGVADAKEMGTSNVETLSDMARIYGSSSVNIMGGTFYKNIYGGGDMAIVEFDGNATNVVIGDSADIRGSVFAGGNGRRLRPASQAFADGDGCTQHPERVGLVVGNTNVSFAGSTQQAPFIYGDIFGGGNLAQVANDTYVNIYAGNIAGEVFGGGNGDITDGTVTSADVLGNTNVTLAQDEGGTQSAGHGPIDDSFSINVIWFKMWDPVENIFYIWDPDIDNAGDEPATEDTVYEKSKFYANGKFLNPHNIYGGGNLACNVGTYKDADGNVTTTPADGTGLATVMMQKGMTPYELLITDEWKQSYTDNEHPHFSVFGGGYGRLTTVGSTDVTVNVDGDYGKYGPNAPSLDLSMGVPNFTVWAVLGGGYAGTVAGNTKVTVDGKTFIRRVFGGGFGDIASTEDNTTGQIGGNTEVYMCGAFTHGDVFGGSAGLEPKTASSTHFITVARVIGTTMVEVADDANIYGNVYGGGDNANVGIFQEVKPSDYYSPDLLTSASTLNQTDGSFISYSAGGYRSFVNIRGGNIFGNVYGGGVGCKKAEANQYYNIGRINGNSLVHIVNSNPGVDSGTDNVVPCVWGDIYGGCEYGTVDGNTFVHIEGGMMGGNVYGGGYSVAQGSVLANNTTVLKLTDKYNLDYAIIANGNGDDLNLLPGGSTAGFCGNTLVLVGDNKDSEHITISHQDIRPVQLPDGTDLYGYYYKHYASDDDAANGIYSYRYISLQDKYFFKSGATPPSGLEGIRENEFYEYDSEGGIFGDGHLSYAQGFRSADLTGYGFAGHTIDNPKILNTFQRLDIIRLEDNCFSLLGARDYTVNDVNKTPYSIARVGEIKMVANDIRFDSNGNLEAKPDNNTDFRYSTKARNYMGFSNNILYVSAIKSNVDFNTGMWRNRNGQLASASTDNTAFAGMSYQGVKQHYIDDYNANKDKENAEDPFGEFQKRNDGTAMNMIGIASGYAMKIQLCHETYDSDRKKVVENKLYGPIYGVVEMNLINVREDEGGGYVYADNNHKRHDGDSHEEDFLETTGNFVFPYHKGRYIVDDCFPTGYYAITAPGSDKTVDDVKVHYWYVTGFHYYYNVNISGYTFKSSKENPIEFDSDNKDGLTVLAGLKSTQPISIFNWKMRSGHPDDKSQYSSDLEYRNYLTGTETNETDKTYYSDAVAGGYKLYVGGAESNNFSGATSIDDPDKASKGFAALLSMREKGDDEATLFNNSLPAGLKEDAKISFRLVDMVDNTNYVEPDYFDKHLGRKSMATLVLKAPAYEEYVSETDNKPIYTNTGKFYKKTETGYELVESGNLDADNTYYQPQTEEFVKIESLFTYNTANKKYEKVDNISNVTIDESNPTIYYVQREYTYTIYLTIEYVQGPTVSGQITIGNCALPGEMVRVTKDNIVVSADQSFAVNGYYWRIGKRQMGADGKWEFKDTTPWTKENISNNVATGYDTFNQADENGKGLFAGCHYDKTDDLLDVPAYYYMNGYGIQLGVSITGLNDILEVDMHDADKFVVHNYHRMDPHKAGINLHLAEAITRVNEESLDTTESDPLPEPRIYISDKSDLSAFVAFVDSIGTDSNAPRYGAKAQFFLQNDIALEATDKGGYYISDFAGILHGDGHVISGIPSGKSLFNSIESSGNIYNLGLASGKISNLTADGKIGNYHCCFEYAPASGKSGSTPIVYRWDGSPYEGYTTEDFRLGRVAYDLNEYYLRARHRAEPTTSSTEADADNEILKYVSAYYANGDYQYACRTDAITSNNTGITYLRIGKGGDIPNYEQVETRHDKTHPLDAPRVKYNADGSIPTPVVYTPLFNANNSGTELMNDFLFWGQSLQHNPDNYPRDIASHQNSYMSNRVYRTAAYYGDTTLDAFHYNAYNNGSITMSTYVHDSATTAVDFTCLHDLPAATETVGGIFYPPMDDNASRFNDFVVKEDAGITQNLLVYTADNDEATGNEAYDVVEKALNYNETTREALINGHHITKGIDGYSTTLLHLVERTPDNENGDGETCNNNNLCVPIAFNVNDRAWYVRRPMYYAEDSKGAWEGICLPFTVDKVAASLNGEITHFYGSPSDAETDNPSQNIHSLHHEYWLRGLTSIASEGNVPSAVFQRPGAAVFSPTDASGNALTNGVSYTFANTFFVDNYADKLYNQYANPYYATAHNYPDYLRLAGEVPYIVRFPGARYYEFDLSSAFYNDIFGAWEDAQTVTFNAYGDNHTGDTSYGAITIPITKGMATMVGGKYSHLGTFSAINVSNGNVYGMNNSGTAFDDASSLSTVTPFRTYMSPTATRSNARYDYTSVINIAEQNADNIMPDMEENEDDAQTEDHITVRAIGNQRVRIESTMATKLDVVTVAGQLYRILDVQPGIATYSDFQPGLYIFGTTKVIVR